MPYQYDPSDKFGYKDLLPDGDAEKVIKGAEFDDEFNKISDGIGDLQAEVDLLNALSGTEEAPKDGETYGRNDGSWVYAAEKVHSHESGNIDGLDDFINNHTHPIADVDDLQDQLDAINNKLSKITSNLVVGGTYDLANDIVVRSTKEDEGVLLAGQPLPADGLVFDTFMILVSGGTMKGETLANGDWIVADQTGTWIPIPYSIAQAVDWGNIQGKPDFDALYAAIDHTHPEYLEDAASDGGQYCRKDGSWAQITGVTGAKGDGWTGGSYDGSTGIVTFTSDDGLGFATGDLRGTNQDSRITAAQISNWDSAYGWGDHGAAGYATQSWVNGKNYSTYTGSDAVKTSGNQTVGGIKTFSSELRCSADVVAYYSDARLKDVQGPIENALDKVSAIESFYYTPNEIAQSAGYSGNEVQVGVSAQSVEAVMPECVKGAPFDLDADGNSVSGEKYLTVQYQRLVPLLLEAVKELRKELEDLKRG